MNHTRRESAPNREAIEALQHWAIWKETEHECGWPRESSEVRAAQRYQTSTNTNGIARYKCTILLEGGRRVRKQAPDQPKETRPESCSKPLKVDRATLGPRIDSMLLDMASMDVWWQYTADLLATVAMNPRIQTKTIAQRIEIKPANMYNRLNRGYAWISGALAAKRRTS